MRTRSLLPALLALASTNCTSSEPNPGTGFAGNGAPILQGRAGTSMMQQPMTTPPSPTAGTGSITNNAGTTATAQAGTVAPPAGGVGGGVAPMAGAGGGAPPVPAGTYPDPRGSCPNLNSGFPDDHA